jgi:hypothetical protein
MALDIKGVITSITKVISLLATTGCRDTTVARYHTQGLCKGYVRGFPDKIWL